jgi:hypothetical protein
MCIYGGYKTQTVTQIANVISAYDAKTISLRAVRVCLAALVSVASREAAKRSGKRDRRRGEVTPKYLLKELSKLTGCPITRIRGELRTLEAAKLICFTASEITFTEFPLPESHELARDLSNSRALARPIPLPRALLRYLAKCKKISTIKTALAYCVRGLTLSRQGEVTGKGSVKATWIANVMGLSERSVRSARSELLGLGWITDDEFSYQRKLNRTGAYFTVNLSWINEKRASKPVDNSLSACSKSAPLQAENCPSFAPPYKDKKTPYGSKNQKTQSASPLKPSGVCIANTGNQKQKQVKSNLPAPNIRDVRTDDLKSFSRVEELYTQAVKCRLIEPTEAGAINFISAAVRAMAVPGDAPRVFMGIIRGKLWKNITQRDEDRALAALRRYREKDPERFRFSVEPIRAAA